MSRPFRRRVLYIPGYDPIPPRRYRELYRREGPEQAHISGYALGLVPRAGGGAGFGWAAETVTGGRAARAEFEVLVWDDIVQGSMGHGVLATYGQMLRTAGTYIASGTLRRMMRLRRGPVLAALYPIAVLLLQLAAALLAGAAAGALLARLAGAPLGWLAGAAVAWGVLVLWQRLDGRIFAHYLMHDYAFTASRGGAYPPALDARIAAFADRIAAALAQPVDEVLVVGHSSGAHIAVSALAALTRAGRAPADGPALALLSLGHVVPMAALLPRADRLRDDLRWLSEQPGLFWLDVTAPGDACCFGLCDPVSVCGLDTPGRRGPLIVSAAFRQTLSAERQRALRHRWFRLHFQYLCAFDRPGDYDYFAITAGPLPLRARFAGRGHSPGRIATPVRP